MNDCFDVAWKNIAIKREIDNKSIFFSKRLDQMLKFLANPYVFNQ